jgi:hypothetical protein
MNTEKIVAPVGRGGESESGFRAAECGEAAQESTDCRPSRLSLERFWFI